MSEKIKAEPKTIRALERGLNVMQILQEKGTATLNDIYNSSTLPRPTILRILRTLEKAGWIRRGLDDGLYRNSFKIEAMVNSLNDTDRLAEISAPYLDLLCRKTSWPSDLAILNSTGLHMELKETSRSLTPFPLKRDRIGHLINLPLSAVGRAYLAFCHVDERKTILRQLRKLRFNENRPIYDEKQFAKTLKKIRYDGFATREPSFGGGYKPLKSDSDDGLNAVAVPIKSNDSILGVITLVWIRKATSTQEIINNYLEDLQLSAIEIANRFEQTFVRGNS